MRSIAFPLIAVLLSACGNPSAAPTGPLQPLPGLQRIAVVPVGQLPPSTLDEVAASLRQKLALPIEVLPPLALEEWAIDRERQQVIAEELIVLLQRGRSAEATDPSVVLIGVTEADMYIRGYTSWAWAFSMRQEPRLAVVSSARMDQTNFGQAPDPALLQQRLRKMITKNIAILYYGRGSSTDPRSVLYGSILGVDDLDRIGEEI